MNTRLFYLAITLLAAGAMQANSAQPYLPYEPEPSARPNINAIMNHQLGTGGLVLPYLRYSDFANVRSVSKAWRALLLSALNDQRHLLLLPKSPQRILAYTQQLFNEIPEDFEKARPELKQLATKIERRLKHLGMGDHSNDEVVKELRERYVAINRELLKKAHIKFAEDMVALCLRSDYPECTSSALFNAFRLYCQVPPDRSIFRYTVNHGFSVPNMVVHESIQEANNHIAEQHQMFLDGNRELVEKIVEVPAEEAQRAAQAFLDANPAAADRLHKQWALFSTFIQSRKDALSPLLKTWEPYGLLLKLARMQLAYQNRIVMMHDAINHFPDRMSMNILSAPHLVLFDCSILSMQNSRLYLADEATTYAAKLYARLKPSGEWVLNEIINGLRDNTFLEHDRPGYEWKKNALLFVLAREAQVAVAADPDNAEAHLTKSLGYWMRHLHSKSQVDYASRWHACHIACLTHFTLAEKATSLEAKAAHYKQEADILNTFVREHILDKIILRPRQNDTIAWSFHKSLRRLTSDVSERFSHVLQWAEQANKRAAEHATSTREKCYYLAKAAECTCEALFKKGR